MAIFYLKAHMAEYAAPTTDLRLSESSVRAAITVQPFLENLDDRF
jgi:hypothetical protein